MRRRARDREKRLSAELTFVKAQLKETLELLASKEEEACLARAKNVEQEEKAAAVSARWKERDRHAHLLERRLAEVRSDYLVFFCYWLGMRGRDLTWALPVAQMYH